nr:hypothetical protein [Tanacetum cinerariifolium]
MTKGGDTNDIRSTYEEIDEEDEVFRSDYIEIDRILYVKDADLDICEEIELSDGTFNYKPIVDESEKPKIGSEYSTIDKCIEIYAKYAEKLRYNMVFVPFTGIDNHRKCVIFGAESLENGIETVTIKEIREIKTRDLLPPHIRRKKQMFGFEGSRYMEFSAIVYSAVEYCLKILAKDEEKLLEFVENVKRLKTEVEEANQNAKQLSKKKMFNLVLGVEKPEVNTMKNPEQCSNKGNASRGQRKKSEIEKLREHMKKHRRLCKKYEKYKRHDLRNCPTKDDEIATDSDSTVVSD